MKNTLILKRVAVITVVFFSLFLLIDFVPESRSNESDSSESNSSESCSPTEKLRNSIINSNGASDVGDLPEDFGEDVKPDPKPGATHNKRTRKIKATDGSSITQKPSSDGCGVDEVREDHDSASIEYRIDGKGAGLEITEESAVDGDGNPVRKERKIRFWIVIEF